MSSTRQFPRLTAPQPGWPAKPSRPSVLWVMVAFAIALAGGAALRFWQLAAKPDWQYDEGVYTRVATNLLQHGTLNEHVTVNTPWQPFLYQPPFYFLALARWFALTGPSIYHARILGVLCSVVTLVALHRLVSRIHGPRLALFVMLPAIFDGWLFYIQRISHIENPLLTVGMLLVGLAGLIGAGPAVVDGQALAVGAALAAGTAVLMARQFRQSRTAEILAYPLAGGTPGFVFTTSLLGGLASPSTRATSGAHAERKTSRISRPLAVILAVQAALSLTLVWSNTIFGDEATYLVGGRIEWAHWLHGTALPGAGQANLGFAGTFQSFFSGAPQIYPPLGALADAVAGLAGARILGLCFMLGATILLYLTASRLFGRRTAIFAAAIWAVSGPVQRLAFATYDPMAIFLVCLGAWFAVEAGYRRLRGEFIAMAGIALALGAVTAYSYAIFVPAAIAVACIAWVNPLGWRAALKNAGWLCGVAISLLLTLPTFLKVWTGVLSTTLARHNGFSGMLSVVRSSWELSGLILILAIAGAIIGIRNESRSRTLLLALTGAVALMVPVEQVRLQTGTSLDKHLAAGMWFAAIAAGFALAHLTAAIPWRRGVAITCSAVLIAFPAISGWTSAYGVYHLWPDASKYIPALRHFVGHTHDKILVIQFSSVSEYYLPGPKWTQWTSLALNPAAHGVTKSKWISYYHSQINAQAPYIIALPLNVAFTSTSSSNALMSSVAQSVKDGNQRQVRAVLLRVATADVTGRSPGTYALAEAIANDPRYQVVSITSYDSHVTTGIYVIWQRVGGAK